MGLEVLKIAKEVADLGIKEIGKNIAKEGLSPKVFNKELVKNMLESFKEQYLDESPKEIQESSESSEGQEAKEKLQNVEDKVDLEPKTIVENPEPVVKELSQVGEFLNGFKGDISELRDLTEQLKGLQNDVKGLIGEDLYNNLASSIREKILDGLNASDLEEDDEDGDTE